MGGGWGDGRDGAWGFGVEGAGARHQMQNANGLQLHHLQQHHVQNAVFSTPGEADRDRGGDRGGDRRDGGGIAVGGGAGGGQGNVNPRHKRLSAAMPWGAGGAGVDVQRESVNSSIGSSAAPSPRKNRYRKAADPAVASPVS